MAVLVCVVCGIGFVSEAAGARYCGRACAAKAYRARYLAAHPRRVAACARCGKAMPGMRADAVFCGRACAETVIRDRKRGGPPKPPSRLHLDDVAWLLSFGVRLEEIAARMGVAVETVTRAVERQVQRERDAGCVTPETDRLFRLHQAERADRAGRQRLSDGRRAVFHGRRLRVWRWAA